MPITLTDTPPSPPLLERAAAGHADALAELYVRHAAAVHATAYRLTGSAADAEDVLHDVFVGLPEALRSFRGTGSLEGWLRRVAARTALMRMRAQGRRREVALEAVSEPPSAPDATHGVVGVAITRALAALPEALRTVFLLREVEGYSHAEIGEMLGLRPGTSQVRLCRAKKILQTLLRNER